MSVQAAGAYFQELIDQRGLKNKAVAYGAGVSENYIWRMMSGDIKEPSAKIIIALTREVDGDLEDIADLLSNPAATADDGRARAQSRLSGRPISDDDDSSLTQEQRQAMNDLQERIAHGDLSLWGVLKTLLGLDFQPRAAGRQPRKRDE